jgi:hypothetical protein
MSKDQQAKYSPPPLPWRLEGDQGYGFTGCVTIPALGESKRLFATLASLATNPARLLERFLVVVVVNHRQGSPEADKRDNAMTLATLRLWDSPLHLCLVDAASAELELSDKTGGVGLARKIGMDLALPRLAPNGTLICLDADTLVEPGYLQAISEHFANSVAGGAVIPFCHQRGAKLEEERAITLYELYLRHYVLGLQQAGSPYAFHSVGSAMACTARAYLKMGGMNSRQAGEDFYFLQQLQRTSGIALVRGTTVHPSARSSHRVPFGTGQSITRILAQGEVSQTFYRVECFRILQQWLALAERGAALSGEGLLAESAALDPQLAHFLDHCNFPRVWERLRQNAGTPQGLRGAFHGWFDALKTVRLVHHLSLGYPRCTPGEALPLLFAFCGLPPMANDAEYLERLRSMQNS